MVTSDMQTEQQLNAREAYLQTLRHTLTYQTFVDLGAYPTAIKKYYDYNSNGDYVVSKYLVTMRCGWDLLMVETDSAWNIAKLIGLASLQNGDVYEYTIP